MKYPNSHRVRFFLRHGRWPKIEARLMLAVALAAGTTLIHAGRGP